MNSLIAAGVVLVLSAVFSCGCRRSHPTPNSPLPPARFLTRTVIVRGQPHRYTVYLPPGYGPQAHWPVILSLHGSGECGTDGVLPSQGGLGTELRQRPERFPCVVVFPQTSQHLHYWTDDFDQILTALTQTVREFHGDPQRLYLTGYSLGGSGTWFLAAKHPGLFAALAPICGRIAVRPERARDPLIHRLVTARDPYAAVASRIGKTPVWVFHGAEDPIIPMSQSRRMVAALKAERGDVRLTVYPDIGHGAWPLAYDDPNLPRWLLARRLKE